MEWTVQEIVLWGVIGVVILFFVISFWRHHQRQNAFSQIRHPRVPSDGEVLENLKRTSLNFRLADRLVKRFLRTHLANHAETDLSVEERERLDRLVAMRRYAETALEQAYKEAEARGLLDEEMKRRFGVYKKIGRLSDFARIAALL